jgi:8-oxo-dGTP pyrophosphatase MutT (NUDIX family)
VTGEGPHHSVSVAGVLIDEDERVLVIQRRDNAHWEPPGGILERDETITEGLLREVREETGLTVEPVALTGVYKNMSRGIVALVFRCRAVGGRLTENSEVSNFRWVREGDVAAMMPEAFAIRVLDAYHPGAVPAIREHDGVSLVLAR